MIKRGLIRLRTCFGVRTHIDGSIGRLEVLTTGVLQISQITPSLCASSIARQSQLTLLSIASESWK